MKNNLVGTPTSRDGLGDHLFFDLADDADLSLLECSLLQQQPNCKYKQ